MQSENINELAKALSLVQSELKGAIKDSANPFFKSKYADLESVWEAIRGPLTKNGLAVSQTMDIEEGPETVSTVLVTTLMHQSGQWIQGKVPLISEKPGPQAMGAAITYYRRFTLAAIIGVFQIDDDANSATHRPEPQTPAKSPRYEAHKAQALPAPVMEEPGAWSQASPPLLPSKAKISVDQKKKFFAVGKEYGWSEADLKDFVLIKMKLASTSDILMDDFDDVLAHLRNNPKDAK